MRYASLPLAALLFACTAQSDNEADNVSADPAATDPAAGTGEPNGNDDAAPPSSQPPAQPPGQDPPAQPNSSISLSASPQSVRAGATVALRLANGSSQQIGYNLCTSGIQTSAGQPVRTDRVCTMELRTLDPDKSATYSYDLPDNLAPGSYRFTTGVEWMAAGNRTSVTSNGITVTSP